MESEGEEMDVITGTWINIREVLPANNSIVVVRIEGEKMLKEALFAIDPHGSPFCWSDQNDNGETIAGVTHWAPLSWRARYYILDGQLVPHPETKKLWDSEKKATGKVYTEILH